MKKFFLTLCVISAGTACCFADIFSNPVNIENVIIPDFNTVSCKFKQTKTIPDSSTHINSGGNFRFIKEKGVIFETTYPVQMVTTYTLEENKRISNIIFALNKKDYSYLNQNFNIFYEKTDSNWTLALKPKINSKLNAHLDSIIIEGETYVSKLDINTLKTGSTKINFTECK